MQFKASVKKTSRENELKSGLQALKRLDVLVGVPEGGEINDEGITNAELAYILSKGSPARGLPAREFLEPSIEEDKSSLSDLIGKGMKAALDGDESSAKRFFGLAGQKAENNAKKYINDGDRLTPNAPSTIKAKSKGIKGGAPPPLVDTGEMRDSITHVVRTGGE